MSCVCNMMKHPELTEVILTKKLYDLLKQSLVYVTNYSESLNVSHRVKEHVECCRRWVVFFGHVYI